MQSACDEASCNYFGEMKIIKKKKVVPKLEESELEPQISLLKIL